MKRIVLIVIAVLVVIQIPPLFFMTNPPVVTEPNWDSPQTRALAQRACFDCHSNETVWPWYSRIAPPSWLVVLDVLRGRRNLNFSDWGAAGGEREGGDMDEAIEQIQQGEMPPSNYLPLHPDAVLSAVEKQQLIDGLRASGR